MFVLIVGCGRVGSAIAKSMLAEGHEVSVLDEDPEAIALLDSGQSESWEELGGRFTVGTALEIDALLEAGIEQADAFVASTDGDNTNLVIAQIAQRRFEVERVVVRVLDPRAPRWYAEQGLQTVCPTADRDRAARGGGARADPLRGRVGAERVYVLDRRRRQGRLEPRARADRQGPRGHGDRDQPPPLRDRSRRSSSTASTTATAPSCGCSSAPASSAPTW